MVDQFGDMSGDSASLAALVHASADEQRRRGYGHTIREICQQPLTWIHTANTLVARGRELADWMAADGSQQPVLLTGSGSSHHIGGCLAPALQSSLGVAVRAVPSGELLLGPGAFLEPDAHTIVVSFGRSGNSPESTAVVDTLLARRPGCRHVLVTCNAEGGLATRYLTERRTTSLVLDAQVHDESLVMTSSFTNMWLAGRLLGMVSDGAAYLGLAARLARAGRQLLSRQADRLDELVQRSHTAALFLGTGSRFGSALEAELKLLEMSGGRVATRAHTFLGVRHGPLAALNDTMLVVCFLSADETVRAYETDLIKELKRKRVVGPMAIAGVNVPPDLAGEQDVVVDYADADGLGDDDLVILDVVVGQLLGLFACLREGLQPDAPSARGVITRVVEPFVMHGTPD